MSIKDGWRSYAKIVLIIIIWAACYPCPASAQKKSLSPDSLLTGTYSKLYHAVFKRDATSLLSFTHYSASIIRRQAWRALAQTPVDSITLFMQRVKKDGSKTAWFALSMHHVTRPQQHNLEAYWVDHPAARAGISLVLGQQGDAHALHFLLQHMDAIQQSDFAKTGALAISRSITKFNISPQEQRRIINEAFSTKNASIMRAWLYGFYRGAKTSLASDARDLLHKKYETYGVGKSAGVDQYMAKMLSSVVFNEIISSYKDALKDHVQLGIELAHAVADVQLNSSNRQSIKWLLGQSNPHVAKQTLVGMAGKIAPEDSLFSYIKTNILDPDSTADIVWLAALHTLCEADSGLVSVYADRFNTISKENPYLYPSVLTTSIITEKSDIFLSQIKNAVGKKGRLKSMYAVNALNKFWSDKTHQKRAFKRQVRAIVFKALSMHDRGVTYACEPLLEDSSLFLKSDFPKINQYLSAFHLPGDVEVYQTFGSLYKKRFAKQGRPVIDSLAALNYAPLNRSLKESGWDVPVSKSPPKFRIPDWNCLAALGPHPVWVLETQKGTIKVRMNTLSAPATVSAIDSLTRSGAYNGVPFHRVVPNFVIQGGDVERGDGFGGPDFVIPTEANEKGFIRGAAGIASAGPDTEGSQYFFMLQGAPHLNGHYTMFGNVIKGMKVMERIVVGDKVQRAYWEF